MRVVSALLLTLAATALPSARAIQCVVGTFIPNAAGQVDINNGVNSVLMSYTCPTESTGCVTAFMRQGFATEEASRLVIVSCQTGTCESASEVVAPNHWYDIRCCTSNNCNREGLNIDWSDRTPTINTGGFPTFPSIPTFSVPTGTTQPDVPTDIPTDSPTQAAAGTQAPTTAGTILRCRQGSTEPATTGQIGADTDSWKSDTCQSGQTFCVTFFERTNDRKFVMANCAETCSPGLLVTSTTQWMETTCCSGDNCNNDISKMSSFDWGERSMNGTASPIATVPPATQAPTSSATQAPTASPISSTGPTTRPTIASGTSTGINNVAFTTAIFNPLVILILAIISFIISF